MQTKEEQAKKEPRKKRRISSIKKRLIIYIAIAAVTLLATAAVACVMYADGDGQGKNGWLDIVIEALLSFFTGSLFAIAVDIVPFYAERRSCKKSLSALLNAFFDELDDTENFDAKQVVLDKYYQIFRDFILTQSDVMGEAAFECQKILDESKETKVTSTEPTRSKDVLLNLSQAFRTWPKLF